MKKDPASKEIFRLWMSRAARAARNGDEKERERCINKAMASKK